MSEIGESCVSLPPFTVTHDSADREAERSEYGDQIVVVEIVRIEANTAHEGARLFAIRGRKNEVPEYELRRRILEQRAHEAAMVDHTLQSGLDAVFSERDSVVAAEAATDESNSSEIEAGIVLVVIEDRLM
jgi:hypothetical protein